MEAIAPVAAEVNPPNPQQGLGTLASLIGLKQAQQNLQTGQYKQQEAQASAQQAQQQNQELQALAKFTSNAAQDPAYLNPDGSANVQKFQQGAMAVAPTYGQAYIGNASTNFNTAVQNRKALLSLSNEQRASAGQYLGAVAAKPGATSDDLQTAIAQARSLSKDPGYQSMVDSMLLHAPQTGGMSDADASTAIRNFARNVAVKVGSVNAGLSAPTTTDYTTPGGAIGQRQTNPLSPMGLGPVGPQVAQGLGPAQTPAYQAAISSAASRASGMAGTDIGRIQQVSSGIQPSTAAIPLTNDIDSLADQIHSGKFVAEISKAAAAVGMKEDTYARQLLAKDLGQVETRATDFGNPTDKKLGTILSGFPEATSDPQTIHTAMDYIRGSFRQNVARGQNMLAYQKAHPDGTGFQQADDQFTSKVDPLTSEYKALSPGAARQGFLKRNFSSAQQAQAFVDNANGP